MYKLFVLCFAFSFFGIFDTEVKAQIKFDEAELAQVFHSGIVTCISDINGDYIDDILVVDQGQQLWLGLNGGGANFIWKKLPYDVSKHELWSVSVADIDRNGWNDIIVAGDENSIKILYNTNLTFRLDDLVHSDFFSQSANFFDINNDGWIDYSICDDNAHARIYENIGGIYSENLNWVDLSLPNPFYEAGNYGILWSDFDHDNDPDLYISRCRAGVDDPTDLRRRNFFYENQNGKFTETGDTKGLAITDQTWTTVKGDFNGDRKQDLFILNHYTPSLIMIQNSAGNFEDRTLESNLKFSGIPIQASAYDFDCDADLDLLISGTATELWINDSKGHFSLAESWQSSRPFSSFSTGDFNEDGYPDVYTSFADLLNFPNNQKDKIFLNSGGKNHWLKLGFKGSNSNLNGIGAKVWCYAGKIGQYRELSSGESYGIQNSLNLHFGLSGYSVVDSLIVQWPSGFIQKFKNLDGDKFYLISEKDSCATVKAKLYPTGELVFCNDQGVTLRAESSLQNYKWSSGKTSDSLIVNEDGIYYYDAENLDLCSVVSQPTSVLYHPLQKPTLNHSFDEFVCAGESVELNVPHYHVLRWQDGHSDSIFVAQRDGLYFAEVQGKCGSVFTDTFTLKVTPTLDPLNLADILVRYGNDVQINSQIPDTRWYIRENSILQFFTGPILKLASATRDTTFWFEYDSTFSAQEIHGSLIYPEFAQGPYPSANLNPQMKFSALEDVILSSVTVFADLGGVRNFELKDGLGTVIASKSVNILPGQNQVNLGFKLAANSRYLYLGTNRDTNIFYLGTNGPQLQRSDKGFSYPIRIEDKVKITESSVGENYYYFFYDWVLRRNDIVCTSKREAVNIKIEPSAVGEGEGDQLMICIAGNHYPVPGIWKSYTDVIVNLYNLSGQLMWYGGLHAAVNDLSQNDLVPGRYFVEIVSFTSRNRQIIQVDIPY
ncbi:MAG: CRTAC1 family protein [Saprospiraceae bacterium]|nr:CRTAC1 family protein [Saprospiraceae bacterium]